MKFTVLKALVACLILAISIVVNICNCTSAENTVQLLYSNVREIKLLTVDLTASSYVRMESNGRTTSNITITKMVNVQGTDMHAIDFNYQESLIFWTDIENEQIKGLKFNFQPKTPPQLMTYVSNELMYPDGVACDWVTNKIYWSDSEMKRILVVHLESKIRKVLYWSDLDQPRAIALVPHRGLMFWTDWGAIPKIERSSMDGDHSARKVIINFDIMWPNALAIDYDSETVYWADAKLSRLERANFDGGDRVLLASDPSIRHPFAVTVGRKNMFWTDWVKKSVSMCSKDDCSSTKELLIEEVLLPMDIHVFSKDRQPSFDSECLRDNGGCSHLCLLSSTNALGYSCQCPTGIKMLGDGKNCASGAREILVLARRVDLRYISLDTPEYKDILIPTRHTKHPVAVDYDVLDGLVYWTDEEAAAIRRVRVDGSDQEDVISIGLSKLEGIAVDWIAKNVYWIDAGADTIEVARTNGSHRKVLINNLLGEPRAIAVHPWLGFIFWSDWGEVPKIERAALDGSMREVIVNTSLRWPNGLAIDYQFNYIYWCDAGTHLIEYASFNGENRRKLVADLPHPFGLSVSGDWVYWTDWTKRSIERAQKSGENQTPEIRGIEHRPMEHREILVDQMPDVMGLKVAVNDSSNHYYPTHNDCSYNNGNCSHLCFFMPVDFVSPFKLRHTCACSVGFKLNSDGYTCKADPYYVAPVFKPKPKEKPEGKNSTRKATKGCQDLLCGYKCEVISDRPRCVCPETQTLAPDNKTCLKPQIPLCDAMNQFACKSAHLTGHVTCIALSMHCDGRNDCSDGSDEDNCPTKDPICNENDHFVCHGIRGTCFPQSKRCDGLKDCPDGSDEEFCCPANYFVCNPSETTSKKQCIPQNYLCDGKNDCDNLIDESSEKCSVKVPSDHPITSTHPPTTYTSVVIICLLVIFAIVGMVLIFRKSNIQYGAPDIVTDITLTRPLSRPERSTYPIDSLVHSTLGARCPVGPGSSPGPFSNAFPSNGAIVTSGGTGSDQPYDRSNVTGASSTSSSNVNHYPLITNNPPPSPVTSTYSSNAASRSSHGAVPMRYINKQQRSRVKGAFGPPPTPCSTDFNDESDSYSRYRPYTNSQIDPYDPLDPYPPPPTPRSQYISEASAPPSPMTERSYCTVRLPAYPNPPPSPEPT